MRLVEALERELGETLRIELVAVVREHFERAASLYNQRVKDGITGEQRDPDAFLAAQGQGVCYANFLKRFRNTRFEYSVINYHPAEDCVQRVLAHLGFARHAEQPPARNVSLSRPALVAALAANRIDAPPEERNGFVAALRRLPPSPAGFIFGRDAAFEAERKFGKDRDFLLRRFDIELPLPDFPEDQRPFGVSETEFCQISDIAARFGTYGEQIREAVSLYVR